MEWYREHLDQMRQLAEEHIDCACCHKPLIGEGHEQVFCLHPDLAALQLREMAPSFKIFAVYLVQCQCGEWFHGDCLMPLQRETSTVIEIRQPNGVVKAKPGSLHTINCPACGERIWDVRGQQPLVWQRELQIRLPSPNEKQGEFMRSYELYLRPHLSSWPSIYLRPRGKGARRWVQYPFPRGGIIPSAGDISRDRGWTPDNAQVIRHQIAQEICTNEITIKEVLGNHIAERERTRTEREHLVTAYAVESLEAKGQRPQQGEVREDKATGWRALFGLKNK